VPLTFEDHQFEYHPPASQVSKTSAQDLRSTDDSETTNGAVHEPENDLPRTSTEQIMDMVDDLVGPDPAADPRSPTQMTGPVLEPDTHMHSPRPASGIFTASDLVRQISQGSPARVFNTPSQQNPHGFGQDPFSPVRGEFPESISGSRPGTSHQTTSPRLGYHRSSGFFNDELTKRQREIDTRTSPIISMEPSSMVNSPNYAFPRNRSRVSLQQDQWQSPFTSPAGQDDMGRKGPAPSRFGAIGDSRPAMTRTPTSGQPG
jgi:hypothetical protein